MARKSNYALRLLTSLKAEAEKVAAEEGTTLNQFVNVAVAEKLAALRTKPGTFRSELPVPTWWCLISSWRARERNHRAQGMNYPMYQPSKGPL
jgi:hypothetical protein